MILLSLHPAPASEMSAFNRIRALRSRCAGPFPFRIKVSSCSRSPALKPHNISLHRVLARPHSPSVARTTTEANHQILSNWLKRVVEYLCDLASGRQLGG